MGTRWDRAARAARGMILLGTAAACAGAPPFSSPPSPPTGDVAPASAPPAAKPAEPAPSAPAGFTLYRQAGFLAQSGAIPFIGSVRYFAGAANDSTLVLVALAFANRSLLFTPEGGINNAIYAVTLSARDSAKTIAHTEDQEAVRVATFRETRRADASIIFERYLVLPPGTYTLAVAVLDPASMAPALRFANTNYYSGGRTPLGRVSVGSSVAPPQDLGPFDALKPDDTLSY